MAFRVNSTGTRYFWITILIVAVALVSFPRFDRQDLGPIIKYTGKIDGKQSFGDAVFYMNYVDYFRGNGPIEKVYLPFRYRPLIPFIASLLPIESPLTAINVVNLTALYVTVLFLFMFLGSLGFDFRFSILGCFLYTVSFPVFYMSTTGYLEACIMCMLTIGVYLIFKEKWLLLAIAIAVGVPIKEVIALLIPVAVAYLWVTGTSRAKLLSTSLLLLLAFVIPTVLIKTVFIRAGDFYWIPSISTLFDNLRVRAMLSLLLSFGLPGILSILSFVRYRKLAGLIQRRQLIPLVTGVIVTVLLIIYSMLTAYTDGRFIWPMTIFTIPMALWVIRYGLFRSRIA
jgi:hypothetical protein